MKLNVVLVIYRLTKYVRQIFYFFQIVPHPFFFFEFFFSKTKCFLNCFSLANEDMSKEVKIKTFFWDSHSHPRINPQTSFRNFEHQNGQKDSKVFFHYSLSKKFFCLPSINKSLLFAELLFSTPYIETKSKKIRINKKKKRHFFVFHRRLQTLP